MMFEKRLRMMFEKRLRMTIEMRSRMTIEMRSSMLALNPLFLSCSGLSRVSKGEQN